MSIDQELYERAAIIPGRSLTRSKAPGRFGASAPRYCVGGSGAIVYGVDSRPYIDMLCGLGAVSLGYGDVPYLWEPGVFSLPHRVEVEAAEAVLAHVAPWASSVRFTKTGSEACHAAYRIAKAATGRTRVLVGNWAYHGWHEWVDDAPKYPNGSEFFFEEGHDVAAIFIEPHRWASVSVEWLHRVRYYCTEHGILLVFDSMIYGGRWALGGASACFGVQPDLECFGKAIGNGQSVACVVGGKALLDHGELVSGTYSGDIGGLSAVVRTVDTYVHEPVINTLWSRGRQLQEGLRRYGMPVQGAPVHQRIVFRDKEQGVRFASEMALRGVLWHPDVTNIMYAHTEEIIDTVIQAAGESWMAVQ